MNSLKEEVRGHASEFCFRQGGEGGYANDLALLKAEGRFAPLSIAASRAVKLGGTVATVGFPNIGLQGFAQPLRARAGLVDERGNVVGVVSAKLSAQPFLTHGENSSRVNRNYTRDSWRGRSLERAGLPENVNYAVKSRYLLKLTGIRAGRVGEVERSPVSRKKI